MLLWPAAYKVEFLARDGTVLDETEVVAVSENHAGEKAWDNTEGAYRSSARDVREQIVNDKGYLRIRRLEGNVRRNTNDPHRGRPRTHTK